MPSCRRSTTSKGTSIFSTATKRLLGRLGHHHHWRHCGCHVSDGNSGFFASAALILAALMMRCKTRHSRPRSYRSPGGDALSPVQLASRSRAFISSCTRPRIVFHFCFHSPRDARRFRSSSKIAIWISVSIGHSLARSDTIFASSHNSRHRSSPDRRLGCRAFNLAMLATHLCIDVRRADPTASTPDWPCRSVLARGSAPQTGP